MKIDFSCFADLTSEEIEKRLIILRKRGFNWWRGGFNSEEFTVSHPAVGFQIDGSSLRDYFENRKLKFGFLPDAEMVNALDLMALVYHRKNKYYTPNELPINSP